MRWLADPTRSSNKIIKYFYLLKLLLIIPRRGMSTLKCSINAFLHLRMKKSSSYELNTLKYLKATIISPRGGMSHSRWKNYHIIIIK